MDTKEQIDACISLANVVDSRRNSRTQSDWRFTLAIWAVLAAALALVSAKAFPLWIGVALAILYGRWLRAVWLRNVSDGEIVWNAINTVERLIAKEGLHVVPPISKHLKPVIRWRFYREHLAFVSDWSNSVRLVTTIGLIYLFYEIKVDAVTLWSVTDLVVDH